MNGLKNREDKRQVCLEMAIKMSDVSMGANFQEILKGLVHFGAVIVAP